MKNYLKSQIKNLPMIIIVSIIFCGINTLATNHLFKAKEVEFDNTNTNIESTNVGDAIDELYTAANNFATYDTRLQGVETKIGTGSLNTTSNTLIGGVNELNNKITAKQLSNWYTAKNNVTFNSSYTYAFKSGDVVTINFDATINGALSGTPPRILTLASGLRPIKNLYVTCGRDNTANKVVDIFIGHAGDIGIYNLETGHNYTISFTYVAE